MARFLLPTFFLLLAGPLGAQEILHEWYGQAVNDALGSAVGGAGDVDQDGYGDLIVGARLVDVTGTDAGMVTVYSGRAGSVLYQFYGDSPGDRLGSGVAGGDDVDGDGVPDLLIGASFDDVGGVTDSGSVRVYSGATGAQLYLFAGSSTVPFVGRSGAVAFAGDVNADGYADIILGTRNGGITSTSLEGVVRVYSGADGSLLYDLMGQAPGDMLGSGVAGAGDVDGDGYDDFLAGAPGAGQGGQAYLYSGWDGSILLTVEDTVHAYHTLGGAVAGPGDVDGDGVPDILVGGSSADHHGADSGGAYVYSGADGSLIHHFDGFSAGALFGSTVSGAGDVDGDGYADLLVGAPGESHEPGAHTRGSVRVFSGLDGSILLYLLGTPDEHNFGQSVSGAGDVDGDGRADIIVGAPASTVPPLGLHAGRATVVGVPPPYLYMSLEDGNPVATLRATKLRPSEAAWVVAALTPWGTTWVGGANVMLDLGQPVAWQGPRLTDAQGELTWPLIVPGKAMQRGLWLQVFQRGLTTNVTGGMAFP